MRKNVGTTKTKKSKPVIIKVIRISYEYKVEYHDERDLKSMIKDLCKSPGYEMMTYGREYYYGYRLMGHGMVENTGEGFSRSQNNSRRSMIDYDKLYNEDVIE